MFSTRLGVTAAFFVVLSVQTLKGAEPPLVRTRLASALTPSVSTISLDGRVGEIRIGVGQLQSWIHSQSLSGTDEPEATLRWELSATGLSLQVSGASGLCVIETSADLRIWSKFAEFPILLPADAPMLPVSTAGSPARFFRAVIYPSTQTP
ncbi:MAG: hypothetical protein IT581_15835 [Verrucomicrobiales bacterium]|nr:hypothetical protein [Verrucomicrobiales bacterium]